MKDKIFYKTMDKTGRTKILSKGKEHYVRATNVDFGASKASTIVRDTSVSLQSPGTMFSTNGVVSDSVAKTIMRDSLVASYVYGSIKNIVDMISEITIKGVRISHTKRSVQKFWDIWSIKADLVGRAERIINTLIRLGNVIIVSSNAVVEVNGNKERVPIKFTLLNPISIDLSTDDEMETVVSVDINKEFLSIIDKVGKDEAIKKLGGKEIVDKIDNNKIYLKKENVGILYYKKDDWQKWAFGIIFSALDDIEYKKKLRDMDRAAADGVINAIRLWKLGNHTSTPAYIAGDPMYEKLADVLSENPGGGIIDIIWDDLIELKVEYPPVEKILGSEKYVAVNADILSDFGISGVLSNGTGAANFASQSMSVKPLVERMDYLRSVFNSWLIKEIEKITEKLGFKTMPVIEYDIPSFTDEMGKIRVALQMWDRGFISNEAMLSMISMKWELEKSRIGEEQQDRKADPEALLRLSPFLNPQVIEQLIMLNNPDYKPDNPGDTKKDQEKKGPGRPKGDDGKPQKVQRQTKPQGSSVIETFNVFDKMIDTIESSGEAKELLGKVEEFVSSMYLVEQEVKYVKQLTSEQSQELDEIIMKVFSNIENTDTELTEELVKGIMRTEAPAILEKCVRDVYKKLVKKFRDKRNREPNKEEKRDLRSSAWGLCRHSLKM